MFRDGPEFGAGGCFRERGFREMRSEEAEGVVAENVVFIGFVEAARVEGFAETEEALDADEGEIFKLRDGGRGEVVGIHPAEAVTHGEGFAAQFAHHVVGTPEDAARAEDVEGGAHRVGLSDGGGVEDDVVEAREVAKAAEGGAVVEGARDMREHEAAAREAAAEAVEIGEVALVGDAGAAHQVEHEDAVGFVAETPHPFGREVLDGDLRGVREGRVEAVGFEADEVRRREEFADVGGSSAGAASTRARVGESAESADISAARKAFSPRRSLPALG